jgi:hypothetical protein
MGVKMLRTKLSDPLAQPKPFRVNGNVLREHKRISAANQGDKQAETRQRRADENGGRCRKNRRRNKSDRFGCTEESVRIFVHSFAPGQRRNDAKGVLAPLELEKLGDDEPFSGAVRKPGGDVDDSHATFQGAFIEEAT